MAHLANPPAQMTNVISLKKQQFPPAVTLKGVPSDEVATCLLALAIFRWLFTICWKRFGRIEKSPAS